MPYINQTNPKYEKALDKVRLLEAAGKDDEAWQVYLDTMPNAIKEL